LKRTGSLYNMQVYKFCVSKDDVVHDVVQSPFTVVEVDLWATTTVAIECPTDLFVRSYWLERSSSRSVTLLVFIRADHSTLQVLTTFYVVLSALLLKACFNKLYNEPVHFNMHLLVHIK